MSDVIVPALLRNGLTELNSLEGGITQAITHIGFGTAQFDPADETAALDTSDEVLKAAITDSILADDGSVKFAISVDWDGEPQWIYSLRFYMASGTILSAYSSTDVETALIEGQSNYLYYTLKLDAIPADKLEIINTQVVFVPPTASDVNLDELALSVEQVIEANEVLTYASWSMFDYITELNRLHFDSGITHSRGYEQGGNNPYNLPTTIAYSAYNGHDHGNIENLVGTAEFGVMWNGIYFRLRHNDDGLYRHADVGDESFDNRVALNPPAEPVDIAAAGSAEEKCELAEKYLKVMAGQLPQTDVADYENSARWIMTGIEVYPEVYTPGQSLKDPFAGHRHQINVDTLPELFKQEAFYNNGGHKNIRENSLGIAMAINDVDENGNPVVVLWRYRFISADVGSLADYPINDLLDYYPDGVYEAKLGQEIRTIKKSRSCRFRVKQRLGESNVTTWNRPELIDELIAKIPGLNGYGNTLTEEYEYYGANDQLKQYGDPDTPLAAGYYNRFYTMTGNDASNRRNAKRGFSDDRMWTARTTDPRIKQTTFGDIELGFSGFIPLELNIQSFFNGNFNPHGLEDKSDEFTTQEFIEMVSAGVGSTEDNPLPGYNNKFYFYKSPADIFDGDTPTDPADTTISDGLWFACADGAARKHYPSGYRYFLPTTDLIGEALRTRYPIYYAAEEGSEAFKYLSAAKKDQQSLLAHIIDLKLAVAKLNKKA